MVLRQLPSCCVLTGVGRGLGAAGEREERGDGGGRERALGCFFL